MGPARSGSISCTCLTCGVEFGVIPAKAKIGDGKYCSVPCRSASAGYRRQVRAALPGTFQQIADSSGVGIETVRDQVFGLVKRGEAHVARLVETGPDRGRGTPQFSLLFEAGPGEDPDVPLTARAALAYMVRKALLAAMPGTQSQLVKRTGNTQGTVSRIVHELHAAGKCHIVSWRRSKQGAPAARYKAGPGKDAVCTIEPMTQAERGARYIEKAARDGRLQEVRARRALFQRLRERRGRRDPMIEALFGPPRAAKEA